MPADLGIDSVANVGGPGYGDGVFDAFVGGTTLGVDAERPVGGLSLVLGYGELVVDVDTGDSDRLSHALYSTFDSGDVVLGGDFDSTHRKGASQSSVHSTADG